MWPLSSPYYRDITPIVFSSTFFCFLYVKAKQHLLCTAIFKKKPSNKTRNIIPKLIIVWVPEAQSRHCSLLFVLSPFTLGCQSNSNGAVVIRQHVCCGPVQRLILAGTLFSWRHLGKAIPQKQLDTKCVDCGPVHKLSRLPCSLLLESFCLLWCHSRGGCTFEGHQVRGLGDELFLSLHSGLRLWIRLNIIHRCSHSWLTWGIMFTNGLLVLKNRTALISPTKHLHANSRDSDGW